VAVDPWLVAAAATALLLAALALKLRGPRNRTDLTGPSKRKPRRLSHEELDRLTALVGSGGEDEAIRQLKSAGYDEAAVRRLLWLMRKVAAADSEA
jgi:hypothetical protein